ncbi:hypothetical protein [Methanothermobacter tenebrarum]
MPSRGEDETNMGDMINTFKRIAENPLSRLLINLAPQMQKG